MSSPAGFYAGSVAISGALAGSPVPLAPGAEPPVFDESSSSGSLFATMGSRSSTPQHPPLLAQPRNSGPASPAHQLCSSPRLGTSQGPLPDASKGDLPTEAGFSDPESEAKRKTIFTISASAGSAKQSPSNKHSPLPAGARGDSSQSHGQDSRKRGRRKRASAGTPSLSSGVSPKRRALPSVAGLFTQSSGSPLNLNSMVRTGRSSWEQVGGFSSADKRVSGWPCTGRGSGQALLFPGLRHPGSSGREGPRHSPFGWCTGPVDRLCCLLLPQVNNINQPLEITAISSPESSLKSSPVPYQDNDQPPVLKKEKPLSQTNGAHYSPLTSDEEPGSEDEPGSAR